MFDFLKTKPFTPNALQMNPNGFVRAMENHMRDQFDVHVSYDVGNLQPLEAEAGGENIITKAISETGHAVWDEMKAVGNAAAYAGLTTLALMGTPGAIIESAAVAGYETSKNRSIRDRRECEKAAREAAAKKAVEEKEAALQAASKKISDIQDIAQEVAADVAPGAEVVEIKVVAVNAAPAKAVTKVAKLDVADVVAASKPKANDELASLLKVKIFNDAFAHISKELSFNPDWNNGTGYLDGLVHDKAVLAAMAKNSMAKFTTTAGNDRRGIVVRGNKTICVVFERFSPAAKDGVMAACDVFVGHIDNKKNVPEELGNIFGGAIDGQGLAAVLGTHTTKSVVFGK